MQDPIYDNPYFVEANTFLNRMVHALGVKSAFRWLDPRHFHKYAFFSLQAWEPHSFQLPGQLYKSEDGRLSNGYKHQDYFRRKYQGWNEDRYLDPLDGSLRRLFVQTVDELYDTENDTSWRRTYIKNISPWILRVAYWPYSRMPDASSIHSTKHSMRRELKTRADTWDWTQWVQVAGCWLPACIGLLILVSALVVFRPRRCSLILATRCAVPPTLVARSVTMAVTIRSRTSTGAIPSPRATFTKISEPDERQALTNNGRIG